jgi:uroporphyrin-III C-methyltransferase
MTGKVYLVGAGPGDPELLTVKALRVLAAADVVLHDELVSPAVLSLAPQSARVYNVGKRCGRKKFAQEEINALMVAFAATGLNVVRLKGGDPAIFGRAGEEIQSLRQAHVEFEVIPGVTAALGAAAAAQIPLTTRHLSSALVFLTGHRADEDKTDWRAFVGSGATLVVYMPGRDYDEIAQRLITAGLSGDTPCAIVSRATTAEEQIVVTAVGELPHAAPLPAPALLVIGAVVRLADRSRLHTPAHWWTALQTALPSDQAPVSNAVLPPLEELEGGYGD